jgi:hypothetical protein
MDKSGFERQLRELEAQTDAHYKRVADETAQAVKEAFLEKQMIFTAGVIVGIIFSGGLLLVLSVFLR